MTTFILADGVELVLTEEQNSIVDCAMENFAAPLCIQAGAGASKTTTLLMIAKRLAEQGYTGAYTAFNKLIVDDGKAKFAPYNVAVGTIHSFAYRATAKPFITRLQTRKKMYKNQVSAYLKIAEITIKFQSENDTTYQKLPKMEVMSLTDETIRNFCNSRDTEIKKYHVPLTKKFGKKEAWVLKEIKEQYVDAVVYYANKLWKDVTDPTGVTPFWHHHYLKIWELGNPLINAHYIMIDEGQDLNPVMLSIVEKNAAAGRKIIIVGDSQQSIYSFTGAIDALQYVAKKGVTQNYLSKSFRFGENIANVANSFLEDLQAKLRLEGGNPVKGEVGNLNPLEDKVDAILTRTNAGGLEAFMALKSSKKTVNLIVDDKAIIEIIEGIEALKKGEKVTHYDLMVYKDIKELEDDIDKEVVDYQISMLYKAIEEYGAEEIKQALKDMPQNAEITIVTAHKSKGREWDNVKIWNDFTLSDRMISTAKDMPWEYLRLCYVAVTRAKKSLDWAPLEDYRELIALIKERLASKGLL